MLRAISMEEEKKKRLTKQEKKKLKTERFMATRKEKRDRRRETKKEKRKELLNSMSVEERKEFIQTERRLTEALEIETKRVDAEGAWLIIDCSYSGLMSELECGSLVSQVEQGTSFLHKQNPQFFKVILTSLDSRVKQLFIQQHADRWPAALYDEEVTAIPGIEQKEVVMLSPDAEEPLGDLDLAHEAYVIGGLVDRTHKKAATLEKALARGVKTRRLPIQETIDPKLNLVLNVNTVMQILHARAAGQSWSEVLQTCIPERQKRILDKINANYEKQVGN